MASVRERLKNAKKSKETIGEVRGSSAPSLTINSEEQGSTQGNTEKRTVRERIAAAKLSGTDLGGRVYGKKSEAQQETEKSAGTGTEKTVRSGSFGGGTSTVKETGFTGNRERSQADWGKIAKGVVLQGADQAATGLTTTGAMLEGAVMKPVGQLLGNEELYKNGLLYNLNEYIQSAAESNQERFQPEYQKGGKVGEAVGKYGAATVAAIPQAIIAFMTAGQSMAAQGTTAGLQAAANAAAKGSGIVQTVTAALLSTAKNPSFQYSLASTMGNEFEQAKADGASDMEAYSYAALAGLANSVVEVGGGIDVLPDGSKSAIREWVGTMLDEGKEEVIQGAISQLVQAAVYGKKNPLFSMKDENAVINPQRAGEEFLGGAVVGGILGGIQIGVQSALGRRSGAGDTGRQQAAQNGAGGTETAADGQVRTAAVPGGVLSNDGGLTHETAAENAAGPIKTGVTAESGVTGGPEASYGDKVTQGTENVNEMDNRVRANQTSLAAEGGAGTQTPMSTDSVPKGNEYVNAEGVTGNGEGSGIFDGGQADRGPGAGTGEQAGILEKGAAGSQQRKVQNVRAGDRADAVAWAYQQAGAAPVSTRELLGTALGTEDAVLREAPMSVIREDSELQSVYDQIRNAGYTPHLFTGRPMLEGGQEVSGMIRGEDVYIRVDHTRHTPEQIWKHEQYHAMAETDQAMVLESWQKLVQSADRAQIMQTMKTYREKYHGIYDVDENGNTVWDETVMRKIVEEILADAYAGKDSFRQGVSRYTDTVQNMVQQRSTDTGEARGPPEGRFTFAGQNARTADSTSLWNAERMEEAGRSAEDIRKETGWFRGMDGQWRFEIDDSGMEYYRGGDALMRNNNKGYAEYRNLQLRQLYDYGTENWSENDQKRFEYLHELYKNEPRRLNEWVESGNATLQDVLKHDALFEAYPELRDAKVRFVEMEDGDRGQYNKRTNTISISNDLRRAPERTLIHEIQHAIQTAEGFTEGASPLYWAAVDEQTGEITRTLREEYQKIFNGLSKEDANKYTRYKEIDRELDRLQDAEDGTPEGDRYIQLDKESDALYLELWNKDWFQRLDTLDRQIKSDSGEKYNRAYRNTAGEIEARDAANRSGYTQEQRRATPPDLGNEDTVFAEGADRNSDAVIREYHTEEQKRIIREYNAAVDQDLLNYVESIQENPEAYAPDFLLGDVSERAASDIKALTGVDATGFDTIIKKNDVEHILKRHGETGQHDQSMRDPEDLARIQYVLDNYDNIEAGKRTTRALRNNDGTQAKTVIFSKKINGTYYVVEAVADNKAKATRVLTAYMSKNGEAQMADVQAPALTSENASASAPVSSVPQEAEKSNGKFYEEGARFAIEDDRAEASATLDMSMEDLFQDADRKKVRSVADLIRAGATDPQLQDAFNQLYDSARVMSYEGDAQELGEIVTALRGRRVYIDPDTKAEFGDDWNSFRKQAFGRRLYFTNNQTDTGLDALNDELAQQFPGYFTEAETDPSAIMERIMDTFQRAKGKQITLDEEARQYGGEDAAQAFREDYRQRFMDAAEQYRDTMRGLDEEQRRQRQAQRDQKRAELDRYVSEARQTLRDRAAEGMPVSGTTLPGPENKAYDIDEYLEGLQKKAEAEKARRLRNIPKAEFKGTAAIEKLGIKIEGSVTDYAGAEELRARQKAAESVRRELKKAEKRLGATAEEKRFASDVAAGIYTEDMIPASMDADKIMELADYYMAERAQGVNMIRQRKADINRVLDERMEVLFKDSDKYKPSKAVVLNNRTPQRNMLKIFGDQQGKIINEQIFDPVAINEAERIRFVNKQFDKARTFTGQDGKQSKLSKQERALTQMVMEGRAVQEIVAGMEMGEAIKRAGENIYNGTDLLDGAAEFGLDTKERDLARKYARWLEAQDALQSGTVDQVKVENAATVYSELFDQYYDAINDFLVVHGYEPIGFIKGYAPHLQPEQNQNLLNKAFQSLGVNTDVTTLPASIAGMTADYKPGKKWNPYFLQRTSDVTEYDIASGFESYVNYLSDVLYHTDDIMRVRRAERYFRKTYAPEEIRNNIEWAEGLRNLKPAEKLAALRDAGVISTTSAVSADDLSVKMEDYISGLYEDIQNTTKYSEFAVYLDNYANILAGKQSMADRGWEYGLGRGIMNVGNKLTRAFARAQVAGNLSSALNQTAQIPQILGENGMVNTMQAAADMMSGKLKRAGFAQESDVLTGKQGIKYLVTDPGDMVTNALFTPAQLMDGLVSTLAVRGAYNKAVKEGMSHQEAMKAADDFGNKVMGSRMKGSRPLAFEAKNPVSQMAHIFQLEALNSWEHMTQDLPRDFREIEKTQGKDKAALALAGVIVKTLLSAFLLNRISEEAYGGTPAPFDLLGLSANFMASGEGLSTNEYLKTVIDNGWEQLTGERFFDTDQLDAERDFDLSSALNDTAYNVMNDIPFVRNIAGLLGLGDQTLPWPDIYGGVEDISEAVKEDGLLSGRTGEAALDLGFQLIPGGRQLSKTYSGTKAVIQGGRTYGYGDNARMQYPVEQSPTNAVRGALFGVNALPESRDFYAGGMEGSLSAKQTQLYNDLVDAGADGGDVFETLNDVKDAETTIDKIMEIADTAWNETIKEMALENFMGEKQYERYMAARDAGILTQPYAEFLAELDRETVQRTGKSGSASQEDVIAALEGSSFTKRQKTAIWNSYGWKKESPWG